MSRPPKYSHSAQSLLSTLEDKLFFVRAAHIRLHAGDAGDAGEVGAMASLLRDLLCKVSGLHGLLWRIKALVEFDDAVHVVDLEEVAKQDVREGTQPSFRIAIQDHGVWAIPTVPMRTQSLRTYLATGQAVRHHAEDDKRRLKLKVLTPQEVILTAANNIGSHTPSEVSDDFAWLSSIRSGSLPAFVRLIDSYTRFAAEIGEKALTAAGAHGFEPRRRMPMLAEGSLEHSQVEFPLHIPRVALPYRNLPMVLSLKTKADALKATPPFHVATQGIGSVVVSVLVNRDAKLAVKVVGVSDQAAHFLFNLPEVAGLYELVVCWNENALQATFNKRVVQLPIPLNSL